MSETGLRRRAIYQYNGQNRMVYSQVTNTVEQSRVTSRYAYDALGRRTIVQDEGSSPVRTLYDGTSFQVVRSGVMFNDGRFTTLYSEGIQWNSNSGTEGSRYRWVSEGQNETRTRSTGDYSNVTARYTGISVTLYGNGEAVAVSRSASEGSRGGPAYLGKDLMGSVMTATNEYGSLEERYEYDAFGQPYTGDLTQGMNLGYTGKPYDSATGLYNYGYRDYKPEAARFTTIDPIRDGANWFAYVNNDPVNWVDPWGLEVTAKLLDNGTVSIVDSDNNQVGILTVTSYKPTLNEYRTGDFNVGAEIEMVYKDSGSGYTDFNFIQTVQSIENRQPLSKRLDAPKLSEPFYNTPQETATYGISNGAYFSDSPTRQNPVDPISWEAETSLVGKNNQGKYEAMATIKWGFNYSPVTETVTGIPPALIQTPSSFHQEKVQSANKCED